MAEKILIVDDDLDTLKLVGLMLQRQGYAITAASTGGQALKKAKEEVPNLILLDVMMPDMDGYEVTRQLRDNPDLAHIPIIMFTAKTMVDDKVAGFEAGVNDYMTKPTHPAELISRVKALITDTSSEEPLMPESKGQIIGVLGTKGGIGASTLTLNLSIALRQLGQSVIACDMRPGQGTLGLQLGLNRTTGVSEVLNMPANQITPSGVQQRLVTHDSGIKLMLSSYDSHESALIHKAVQQAEALALSLAALSDQLVIDMGAGINSISTKLIHRCDQVILIVEPTGITLTMAQALLDNIEDMGVPANRVSLVMINHIHATGQLSSYEVETELGYHLTGKISAAPKVAYQADSSGVPMILIQSDSVIAEEFNQLAKTLMVEKQAES